MRREALLSVLLSVAMILGSASPAFAAGQMPSSEVTADMEASVSESQAGTEDAGQDDSNVNSGQESVDEHEADEEGEIGTEAGSEETGIEEEVSDEDSNITEAETDPTDESKTDAVVDEEEKPETLVGAEGQRVSVGPNVTAGFDSDTGTVTFYSQGGTLSSNWANTLGINKADVRVITVSEDSDVMYLPPYSLKIFSSFIGLQSLDLSKVDTSKVGDMGWMFQGCQSLQTLDVSGFDTSNVRNMNLMFFGCSSLQTLDISGFNTSNVTGMHGMFESCSSLQALDVSGFNTSKVTSMDSMFEGCENLRTLDVSGFDTSNVTNMASMFRECKQLETLDLSGFNTSNVTYMQYMFWECNNLKTLIISGFNTENVTNMGTMFCNCRYLTNLDLSSFRTSSVQNMGFMFSNCDSLVGLNLSNFDTSNVTDMYAMFQGCEFSELDLRSFNTSKVTDMDAMFNACKFNTLDISSFDFSGLTNNGGIFGGFVKKLITPENNTISGIRLPFGMYDSEDNNYTELPISAESIVLTYRQKITNCFIVDSVSNTTTLPTYIYDGSEKKPTFYIKEGGRQILLEEGTDYTVSYADNINAGTATVIVTGINDWVGTLQKTFSIEKATPEMTFAFQSINKKISDTAFTNTLTKKTDGAVTFKSSNKSVATVNSTSGKVTIKGAGTTTITATAAAGTNYKAGSAQYTLTVTESLKIVSISDDFYGKTGTQASFHIEAEGSGTITYQWQYRTAGMTSWKAPAKASAKTADYTFGLKPSYDNIEVRCIISDGSGRQVISETRKANVFAILSQPDDVTAPEGQRVVFEVSLGAASHISGITCVRTACGM